MKKFILIILFIAGSISSIFGNDVYDGDMVIESDVFPINVTFEAVSLPFEGYQDEGNLYNRIGSVFNGVYHTHISI